MEVIIMLFFKLVLEQCVSDDQFPLMHKLHPLSSPAIRISLSLDSCYQWACPELVNVLATFWDVHWTGFTPDWIG